MRVRIVVADQAEARFYDVEPPGTTLQVSGRLLDPSARLHERELVSDRPGRVFDRAPTAGERRGAVAHHDTGGERSARHEATVVFVRRIVEQLEQAYQHGRFERLVLMAEPRVLGMLRAALPARLEHCVLAEVHKDLVHQSDEVVRAHIPPQALR
jgi:protein required for attachment to host cells